MPPGQEGQTDLQQTNELPACHGEPRPKPLPEWRVNANCRDSRRLDLGGVFSVYAMAIEGRFHVSAATSYWHEPAYATLEEAQVEGLKFAKAALVKALAELERMGV